MDPSHLAVLLLILGLALLVAEFFVPSGGMITIMAIVSLVSSVWFAWQAWGASSPSWFYAFLVVLLVSLPSALGGTLYVISNTRLGSHVLLEAPRLEEVTPYQREQQRLQQLVGKRGRTLTLLNPGGLVLVDGERVHSETPGLMLDPNVDVEVIAVKGTRVVVAPASSGAVAASDGDAGRPQDARIDSPLDFDLPDE